MGGGVTSYVLPVNSSMGILQTHLKSIVANVINKMFGLAEAFISRNITHVYTMENVVTEAETNYWEIKLHEREMTDFWHEVY